VLFPFEVGREQVLEKRMPAHWTQVGQVADVTIWKGELDSPTP
jgi:hypothetical protein